LQSVVGSTVAPTWEAVNSNVAEVSAVSASGPESIVTSGNASIVQVREAGDWSVLPAALARTWKVCGPSERSSYS
jgi:hypothetical protein